MIPKTKFTIDPFVQRLKNDHLKSFRLTSNVASDNTYHWLFKLSPRRFDHRRLVFLAITQRDQEPNYQISWHFPKDAIQHNYGNIDPSILLEVSGAIEVLSKAIHATFEWSGDGQLPIHELMGLRD
jgi:hypothetical protein